MKTARGEEKMEYAPVMELVDMRDLGAVTSVKVFPFRPSARIPEK